MPTDNTSVIDQRLLGGLSGGEKLKLLIEQQAGSVTRWAIERRVNPIEIHHVLSGRRAYQEHRQLIAGALGLELELVEQLLEEGKATAVA